MNEELREKVARAMDDQASRIVPRPDEGPNYWLRRADAVLAIPEIAAALARPERIDVKQDRIARLLWEASHESEADWSGIEGVLRQVYEDRAVSLLAAARSVLTAERDALAARLAAWPEVPDGHEVLVVPSEVVDFYTKADPPSGQWAPMAEVIHDACRATVAARPPVEPPAPETERVPVLDAIRNCRKVPHPDGSFSAIVAMWHEGALIVASDAAPFGPCQVVAPDGTIEVTA